MTDLLFRGSRILELCGRGLVRFYDQSSDCSLLCAGLESDSGTWAHGLFGVYGMLGLGLMLFCLRALRPGLIWKDRPLSIAFWSINIGLGAMVLLSTLPIGLAQAWASVEVGMWYARSSEFLHTPMLTNLRWMRMFGDTIFAFGAIVLGWFVLGLITGHSFEPGSRVIEEGQYTADEPELVHHGD